MTAIRKYIKALIPIRLFNSALWMEEEDIASLSLEQFNSTEVQAAITANTLIEVNSNDLPVDVVSPHLKFRGDWDASNNALPIGRRIGDVYRVIGAGVVGGVHVSMEQLVFFRNLYQFDFLGFTLADLEASQYIFKTKGDWNPIGAMGNALVTRSTDAVIGSNGTNQTLIPNPILLTLGSVATVSSGQGIPVTGVDPTWSKIIAPNLTITDNVQSYGMFFLNESAEPDDFAIITTGGYPSNLTFGAAVIFNPMGFTSYSIVNSLVSNTVTTNFSSPIVAGDVLYIGLDLASNRLLVQHGAGGTIYNGAPIVSSGNPSGETLFASVFMNFSDDVIQFNQGSLEFDVSTTDNGKLPTQSMGAVTPPVGAVDGQEFRVTSSGVYNGYYLKKDDVVKFWNNLADLVITRVPTISNDDIPPGILSVTYDTNTQQLDVARLFADGKTDTISTLIETAAAAGYAGITDVIPQVNTDNVGNKVKREGGEILTSCTSGTGNVRVKVVATTGSAALKPSVTVNGVPVTNLTKAESRVTWDGYLDFTISSNTVFTVVHEEGSTNSCAVAYEPPPVVATALFIGNYPLAGQGQTEYASGSLALDANGSPIGSPQTATVTVTSILPFVAVEFQDSLLTATEAHSSSFAAVTSKDIALSIANRGNTTQALPARVRIQNATGTWSAWHYTNAVLDTDHVGTINLNNTRPSVSYGAPSYPTILPAGPLQQAIKLLESATLPVTYSNCDSVIFTSPNGFVKFLNPTNLTGQSVSIDTAGVGQYSVSVNNVKAEVSKTSNGTSGTFLTFVNIADVAPRVHVTLPADRLRSGVAAANHSISLVSNQRMLSVTSLTPSIGEFVGSWVTANSGLTWTRNLAIVDTNPKGTGTFTGLVTTSLSGMVVETLTAEGPIPAGDTYVAGGFTQRVINVPAYVINNNREADIGTYVTDTSKLRATNLSEGDAGTLNTSFGGPFAGAIPDLDNSFTITGPSGVYNPGGRLLYNRDLANAQTNSTGLAQFEIEELV